MCEKRIPAGRSLFSAVCPNGPDLTVVMWIKRFIGCLRLPDEPSLHTDVSILDVISHHVVEM